MASKLPAVMAEALEAGAYPVGYRMTPYGDIRSPNREHEFKWKPHFNSRVPLVRVAYNLTREEHETCKALYALMCQRAHIPEASAA